MQIRFRHLEAYALLRRATRVLLVSHPKPDGDTLGAALAMYNFCVARGIGVTGFCKDPVPYQYADLPNAGAFTTDYSVFADPRHDLLAVFDAGDLRFAGIADAVAAMPARPTILNFDHHATNEKFGDVNVLDVAASSTAEVVYDFLRLNGATIDRPTAACILTGILFDTGSFSNAATTESSLLAAADLLRGGAKLRDITNAIYRNKPMPALSLWGSALDRLKHHPELGIASTAIFKTDLDAAAIDDEHVEGLSNFLNRTLDVRAILVLKELAGGKVKASFRSVDDTDVSAPALALGGGGHRKAAGATITGRIVEGAHGWRVERPTE